MSNGCCDNGKLETWFSLTILTRAKNIPSICLNVGPMLNGYMGKNLIGSGTVVWKARELHASGDIDEEQLVEMVTRG